MQPKWPISILRTDVYLWAPWPLVRRNGGSSRLKRVKNHGPSSWSSAPTLIIMAASLGSIWQEAACCGQSFAVATDWLAQYTAYRHCCFHSLCVCLLIRRDEGHSVQSPQCMESAFICNENPLPPPPKKKNRPFSAKHKIFAPFWNSLTVFSQRSVFAVFVAQSVKWKLNT